jgi:hypothetical protein
MKLRRLCARTSSWRRTALAAKVLGIGDRRLRSRDISGPSFLRKLARRSLRGVKLVISDAHKLPAVAA